METLTAKNLKKLNSKRGLQLFLSHDDMTVQKVLKILNHVEKNIKLLQFSNRKGLFFQKIGLFL